MSWCILPRDSSRKKDTVALGAQTQTDLERGSGRRSHRLENLENHPGTILQRATVAVGPGVGSRVQELAQAVTVRSKNLDAIESRVLDPLCSRSEISYYVTDFDDQYGDTSGCIILGGDRLKSCKFVACARTTVMELDCRGRIPLGQCGGQSCQAGQETIVPYGQLSGECLASPGHMRCARHYQTESCVSWSTRFEGGATDTRSLRYCPAVWYCLRSSRFSILP